MDATVKAHGLDGTLEKPTWAALTMAELRALLRRYPECGKPVEILRVSPRPFSAACVVRTAVGTVFVKRHSCGVRDTEGLLEEHRFMEYLRAHGAAVPRVFRDGSGLSTIADGEWTYEVHEAPAGIDLYGEALSWTPFRSEAHARSAGMAMARMHLASQGFDAPERRLRPLVAGFTIFASSNAASELHRYIAERSSLARHEEVHARAEEALGLLAPFHEELRPLLPALEPLWTHNDLHASNLLWSDASEAARASTMIDFGLADRTNAVHDIACAIERNVVEWLVLVDDPSRPDRVPVHFDHLHALLDGYECVRPLSESEAAALAPMTAVCHAEFALSEADYFLSVLGSEEKARMAYDGWLVGHARWFRGEAGERLLDDLRAWAARRETARVKA
jgi:Ser/Thr protein kinase RdoA (MazF antagonist)